MYQTGEYAAMYSYTEQTKGSREFVFFVTSLNRLSNSKCYIARRMNYSDVNHPQLSRQAGRTPNSAPPR